MPDPSEADLWGLKPDAPASPPPMATPAPLNFSEGQKWGTEALPGQTRAAPHALATDAPLIQSGPVNQQALDDAREFDLSKKEEIDAYQNNRLSVIDYSPLPDAFTREQHQDWNRLKQAEDVLARIQAANPKEYRLFKPQVDQMRRRIDNDVKARAEQGNRTRREQLARDDAPYQSVEQRDKTSAAMETHVGSTVTKIAGDLASNNTATARQADYDVTVSPITTMSKALPGKESEKPNATNRDYTPLRDAATDIAIHNRGMPPDKATRYAIIIGTPGGGTNEKGEQVPGFNGRRGMGATNYKVIGRDDLGNVLVQMNDGQRMRIPGQTFKALAKARQQGEQRAREFETKYKQSQEPGMIRRAINWGVSKIPETGF